jgi:polyferredoxin
MRLTKNHLRNFFLVLLFGLLPAIFVQFFTKKPSTRKIHIRSFRYGKDPYVIRCNRGDTLLLTFSSDDTGHSFYLEEFDIDVKVYPADNTVSVFKISDPTSKPLITKEVTLVARHPGVYNYIISKSNYRCHVWCGPMHAFEQGKLIILPNTLLVLSLGCMVGILVLWFWKVVKREDKIIDEEENREGYRDILKEKGFLRRVILSRNTQAVLVTLTMVMIYIVVLTSVLGTKVSGRNLGVLMMWAIWLFALVAFMTPFLGRFWCTICPLPFFGDLIQRKSFFNPLTGKTKIYNNKFSGFFLKWPKILSRNWFRLIIFLMLATFSTTLVAIPRVSGITVLMLLVVPTLMSGIFELRAFCRYVCPVSVFVGPYSRMSTLALRNKSQKICDQCKPHYCQKGNATGWACPYGLNVGEINENSDCGLCLECLRSCTYDNISLYVRPFGREKGTRSLNEAWMTIATFTIAVIYSILYLGPWPAVRDYVNIIDKHNWNLFAIYALVMWSSVLVVVPGIIYLLSIAGKKLSKITCTVKEIFMQYAGMLLPFGLLMWIAFVIPMLFVNITFIIQSASDPLGWGWDLFGTAGIPWHQFLPQYIPWFQSILLLTGFYLSLRNLKKSWVKFTGNKKEILLVCIPAAFFLSIAAAGMILFFTN